MKTMVFCTLTFEALHRWPAAKGPVVFLKYPHRHIFHVKAWKGVSHSYRQVEFITLKHEIGKFISLVPNSKVITWSCEMWARFILEKFSLDKCEVSEDGENGALVEREEKCSS